MGSRERRTSRTAKDSYVRQLVWRSAGADDKPLAQAPNSESASGEDVEAHVQGLAISRNATVPTGTGTVASPLLFFVTTSGLLCCYSCNGPTPLQPIAPAALPSPQSLVHGTASQAPSAPPAAAGLAAKSSAAYPPTAPWTEPESLVAPLPVLPA